MKKKFFMPAAIAALMGVGAYFGHATVTPDNASDLLLANAEALAESEVGANCGGCASNYSGKHCCYLYLADIGLLSELFYPGTIF